MIKLLCPPSFHGSAEPYSFEEIYPSDEEEEFAVTDGHPRGYTGKSSGLDLLRTVIDLKSKHGESDLDSMGTPDPLSLLAKRCKPVSVLQRFTPLHQFPECTLTAGGD